MGVVPDFQAVVAFTRLELRGRNLSLISPKIRVFHPKMLCGQGRMEEEEDGTGKGRKRETGKGWGGSNVPFHPGFVTSLCSVGHLDP